MVYKYKLKTDNLNIDEAKVRDAIHKVQQGSHSIRRGAREAGVSDFLLRCHMRKGWPEKKSGGQTSIPWESERQLSELLDIRSKWGFTTDKEDTIDFSPRLVRFLTWVGEISHPVFHL